MKQKKYFSKPYNLNTHIHKTETHSESKISKQFKQILTHMEKMTVNHGKDTTTQNQTSKIHTNSHNQHS